MEAIDIKPQPTQILYILNQASHISAEHLANALGLDKRAIRSIIHNLRLEGHLIGSGDNGYHLITTIEQLDRFEAREMASINNRLRPLQAMREKANKLWGGQGDLF